MAKENLRPGMVARWLVPVGAALAVLGLFPGAAIADEPHVEAIAAPAAVPTADAPWQANIVSPLEAQCGAVRSSAIGSVLDSQRMAVEDPRHALHVHKAKEARIRRVVLGLAAEEARNRDAGTALEVYWSLSEAEHSLPDIEAAVAEVEAALADLASLAGRGLELPVTDTPLRSRRITLEEARITAAAAVDSMSIAVCQLAGLPPGRVETVHPAADRGAVEDGLDVEALVAEGLARRAELRMIRAMLAHLDADTVDVGRLVLSLVNPALASGMGSGQACRAIGRLLHPGKSAAEVRSVSRQLRQLLRNREAAVEAEIRMAARLVEAAADKVETAERQRDVAERAAADARSKQPVGDADAFGVRVAELEVIAARRVVVERLAAWEQARAKLWLAQGVLVDACCGCR